MEADRRSDEPPEASASPVRSMYADVARLGVDAGGATHTSNVGYVAPDGSRRSILEHPRISPLLGAALSGTSVLEVCCGDARHERLVRSLGARSYVGLDINDAMLASARAQRNVAVVMGDAALLPIRSRSVEVVLLCEAFGHIHRPSRFLLDLVRVLRPGGRFVWVDALDHSMREAATKLLDAAGYRSELLVDVTEDVQNELERDAAQLTGLAAASTEFLLETAATWTYVAMQWRTPERGTSEARGLGPSLDRAVRRLDAIARRGERSTDRAMSSIARKSQP